MNFRIKLWAAMMLVITVLTGAWLYVAQRKIAAEVEYDLEREFQWELNALQGIQEVRLAALAERCRALVGKPRIHAALEDGALDLLYPSARDELRDVMDDAAPARPGVARSLRARFYRFLDANGAVIPPPRGAGVGDLRPEEEARLTLPGIPDQDQLGYLRHTTGDGEERLDEVITMPIISTDTQEVIAALVVGFQPAVRPGGRAGAEMKRGIFLEGGLHLPELADPARVALGGVVGRAVKDDTKSKVLVDIGGGAHRLFFHRLNPGSLFPPAYEVCVYPLAGLLARQQEQRWQIIGAGLLLLLAGLVVSHFFSGRLSAPVEKLAVTSEQNRTQRARAEAALESTSEELQRSARFAADASHQLKTPVTVLRAGLEELRAREQLTPDERDEISALIHQTFRLTGMIEDLLLLARMEAGRVRLDLAPVSLSQIIAGWLDDLSALPDALGLEVVSEVPAALHISGEPRYTTMIVQNLLLNARKYNRRGGRIRIGTRVDREWVVLTIGNTGPAIPAGVQERIFERFHRGTAGENVPGHGLGLNLAQELAHLHGGELRLARSHDDWTEFEVRFRLATPAPIAAHAPA